MSARKILPTGYTTEQAERFVRELDDAGLILADGTLMGPPDRYCASEIWCYIFYLWDKHRDTSQLYANMSTPRHEMDSARACDVVTATIANRAEGDDRTLAATAADLSPQHLFLFIKLVHASS
jgi:hypothetical protein